MKNLIVAAAIVAVVAAAVVLLARAHASHGNDRATWVARCVRRATSGTLRANTAVCEAMYQDMMIRRTRRVRPSREGQQ